LISLKESLSNVLLLTLLICFFFSSAVMAEGYLIGHNSLYMGDEWMQVTDKAIHFYASEQGWEVTTQNADLSVEEQVNQMRYFVEQGVDGIIWSPVDAEATASVAEYAAEQGIPTVTYNTDVNTDVVPMNIRFDSYESASVLANEVIDHLKETKGEPEGVVISLQGDAANDADRERAEGYSDVFKQYDGIEFIEYFTHSDATTAQNDAYSAIQQFGRPVAIVSQNTINARGGVRALDRADMLVPRGEEGHVFIASMGAPPDYLDLMAEGYVDRAHIQPNLFYGPLAMHFLVQYIEGGEEALPDVGDIITEEDLKITGGVHDGVAPWEEQVWAPAEVKENYGHRWLAVRGMLVTPENLDDPTIWGNTAAEWLE